MTLDEAIEQFKYDAECNRADLDLSFAEDNDKIAEWLEELKQYRAIGTQDECRALKDRLVAKKVSLRHVRKFVGFDDGKCPTCGESVSRDFDGVDVFCQECGQRLDWSDEE